jgi:8-oxo-dGTP pyrophosphatase MutT (NUDIX family)
MMGGVTELHRSVVRVVPVNTSGRVLLLHVIERQHLEQGDCWELPGGGIDSGETVLATAQRELLEETGLRVPVTAIRSPHWFRTVAFLHAGTDVFRTKPSHWPRSPRRVRRSKQPPSAWTRMRFTSDTAGGQPAR